MTDYEEEFWGKTCGTCKYYTDIHIKLWGQEYPLMNKCEKQSMQGYVTYSLESSNCEEWEEKNG